MFEQLAEPAVRWLAATGSPNWLVVLLLLTHPAVWSRQAHRAVRTVADRRLGSGGGERTETDGEG